MNSLTNLLSVAKILESYQLPIGAYVVDKDGHFVYCNFQVREILGLPSDGPVDASIIDFCVDPRHREELNRNVEEAERVGKHATKIVLPMKIRGREVFVQDSCRTVRDPETGESIGYTGTLSDVTEEENYRRLSDYLPVGVYRLDKDGRIVYVNDAFLRVLGFKTKNEVEGRYVKELYADQSEAEHFEDEIKEAEAVTNRIIELVRESGDTVFVSASARVITSPAGEYTGREGTIVDVTTEERYRRILEDVPVGFYYVRVENGIDVIRQCNIQFARMFDYNSPNELIGYEINELYQAAGDYQEFKSAIEQRDIRGQLLLGYPLRVRSNKGRSFVIEVNSRLLHDKKGTVVGRVGVVRDISQEANLKQQVREFSDDIGRVLHAYTSTLLTVRLSIDSVLALLYPDPFDKDRHLHTDAVAEELSSGVRRLTASLGRLLHDRTASRDEMTAFAGVQNSLANHLTFLNDIDQNVPHAEFRHPVLRDIALQIVSVLTGGASSSLDRGQREEVIEKTKTLLRVCGLVSLHQARDAIIDMAYQVSALREYVTSSVRTQEAKAVRGVSALVREAVSHLVELAKNESVKFRYRWSDNDAVVEVVVRDALRAITNLLQNAIRFSWPQKTGQERWVTIRTRLSGDDVLIEIENLGVPIPRDEIDDGTIFQIGYRGRISTAKGYRGTGVGLTDSRRVALEHGGDVTIESRPVASTGNASDYNQPFVTTATFRLPLYHPGVIS